MWERFPHKVKLPQLQYVKGRKEERMGGCFVCIPAGFSPKSYRSMAHFSIGIFFTLFQTHPYNMHTFFILFLSLSVWPRSSVCTKMVLTRLLDKVAKISLGPWVLP